MTQSTTQFRSPLLVDLEARGFLYQATNLEALDAELCHPQPLYCGYDATAPSLHIGNLLSIMLLRRAQQHGHTPIVLLGGGTTKVGDPTGKDTMRPVLTTSVIQDHMERFKQLFRTYLHFDGVGAACVVDNNVWLEKLRYLDFLQTYGPHFSINRMLTFDSVKQRLEREQPLSFLEFNYMILQAYDFLELYRTQGCLVQVGGADQWGNIVAGVELVRRTERAEVFGLTIPLLLTASGKKMGKTENGAVWLSEEMTSPFAFWQFWRNTDDADVVRLLKLFTDLPPQKIDDFITDSTTNNLNALIDNTENEVVGLVFNNLFSNSIEAPSLSALKALKILLAREVTRLAHGKGHLALVYAQANEILGNAEEGDGASSGLVMLVGQEADGSPRFQSAFPVATVRSKELEQDIALVDLLHDNKVVESKSEARRLMRGNGCKINDELETDEMRLVRKTDFRNDPKYPMGHSFMKIKLGKTKGLFVHLA